MILAAGVYPQLVAAVADIASGRLSRAAISRLGITLLFAGAAIFGAAGAVRDGFTARPVLFLAAFLGLTLGGAPLLFRMAGRRGFVFWFAAVAGAAAVAIPVLLAGGPAAAAPVSGTSAAALFGAGAVAAFAMVLPGISGSTLLLLMGMYLPFLDAVDRVTDALARRPLDSGALAGSALDLLPFAGGILLGVAVAARLVRYFLGAHRRATLGALFGLLLGAAAGLSPFQTVSGVRFLPTGAQLATAAAALAAGFLCTLLLGGRRREGS